MRRADNLTIFMCRVSWNLGASTSWKPQGLPRPVMGLLNLLHQWINIIQHKLNNFSSRINNKYWRIIHSFSSLSYDMSKASCKARSQHSSIQSFPSNRSIFSFLYGHPVASYVFFLVFLSLLFPFVSCTAVV